MSYRNMSHTEAVVVGTGAILKNTFLTNFVPKAFVTFFASLFGMIVSGNEIMIGIIILLYFINLSAGSIAAAKNGEWESKKFFMGCTKFLVYGVFMVIGVALGEALHMGGFWLGGVFAFLVLTDSASILENLEKIGYNTPMFLKKYLKVAQKSLEEKYSNPIDLGKPSEK